MRKLIYIAGPLSDPSPTRKRQNIQRAEEMGRALMRVGFAPIIPHLTGYMDPDDSMGYESWLEVDFALIKASYAMVRLSGDSPGSDRERDFALSEGKSVFTFWGFDENSMQEFAEGLCEVICPNDEFYSTQENQKFVRQDQTADWVNKAFREACDDYARYIKDKNILDKAKDLTSGGRLKAYGHPSDNFTRIAYLLDAYFQSKFLLKFPVISEGAFDMPFVTADDVPFIEILQKIARQLHSPQEDNLVDIAGYARTAQMLHETNGDDEVERI